MSMHQNLDEIIQTLCIPHAQWTLGAGGTPLHIKRRDLQPVPRGWHKFIIYSIFLSGNKSEVIVKRAVLIIHSIIQSEEVRVENIIAETISEIVEALYLEKPLLAFLSIIFHLCTAAKVPLEPDTPIPVARPITATVMERGEKKKPKDNHTLSPSQSTKPLEISLGHKGMVGNSCGKILLV
ncbi:hypothetical protein PIB30_090862 [Stylosanthes scabra]|uniref:Putative plant transposon protein domain-containing protein n=1 Tax=Stylosanthes scabra TaxID=79078 RepID=A0ABU6SUU2_9FABA|nr:hypothetical protein [Stylosanthes scabra]